MVIVLFFALVVLTAIILLILYNGAVGVLKKQFDFTDFLLIIFTALIFIIVLVCGGYALIERMS